MNLLLLTLLLPLFITQTHGGNLLFRKHPLIAGIMDRGLGGDGDSELLTTPTTIKSQGPDTLLARQYSYLTGASYCFHLSQWNCTYCQKANSFGHEYEATVRHSLLKTVALITLNHQRKEAVVTYRGTYSAMNAIEEIAPTKVEVGRSMASDKDGGAGMGWGEGGNPFGRFSQAINGKESDIMVHHGYIQAAKSLYPKVIQQLGTILHENVNYSVVFTGHSLGAAMASVSLYMLMEKIEVPKNFPELPSFSYFGYGGPRVGNRAYADYWNSKDMQVTRVVNKKDSVAHLPMSSLGFVHFGTELWLTKKDEEKVCSKSIYEDPTCSVPEIAFSLDDHVSYWDIKYMDCALNNPGLVLVDFVV